MPIEESALALQHAVEIGKARAIGLSEASADTIRRAHAVAPVKYVEQEWSLWSRDIEEEIVPTAKELGIKIVAYSPLGRGFLTGAFKSRSDLNPDDYRSFGQPKFAEENFQSNLELVNAIQAIADRKGITKGQLALAWLHSHGSFVIPIPGTSTISHLDQNIDATNIVLSEEELQEIENVFDVSKVQGGRYDTRFVLTFESNKANATVKPIHH